MDGSKVCVGEEDMAMACNYHPYNNNPGGICGFCLQEKLGKLVSSSFPLPMHASSPSHTPFKSDVGEGIGNSTADNGSTSSFGISISAQTSSGKSRIGHHDNEYHTRSRIPHILTKKDEKKKKKIMATSNTSDPDFNKSKSITPRMGRFLDAENGHNYSPRSRKKAWFWSFMHLSSKSSISKKSDKCSMETRNNATGGSGSCLVKPRDDKSIISSSTLRNNGDDTTIMEDDGSPNIYSQENAASDFCATSFEHKVSRSRSVGCGSRRFGDCSLRRVESQREGKCMHKGNSKEHYHCMKGRAKCGGIFAGFIMTSSSYLISSSSAEGQQIGHGKSNNRSWSWALASPMRAFSKPSRDGKRNGNESNNSAPNLPAIPSLLAVRS